jgi:hypothetical protein
MPDAIPLLFSIRPLPADIAGTVDNHNTRRNCANSGGYGHVQRSSPPLVSVLPAPTQLHLSSGSNLNTRKAASAPRCPLTPGMKWFDDAVVNAAVQLLPVVGREPGPPAQNRLQAPTLISGTCEPHLLVGGDVCLLRRKPRAWAATIRVERCKTVLIVVRENDWPKQTCVASAIGNASGPDPPKVRR